MIVKCWNCHTEIEVVSSARDSNKHNLTAAYIEELLIDNMFDGDRGGIMSMSVNDMVKEVAKIITED